MNILFKTLNGYTKSVWPIKVFMLGAFLLYLFAAAHILSRFMFAVTDYSDDTTDTIRNLGLLMAAYFGAPLIIWRSLILNSQANTAEERLFTERFAKAVEQLGSLRQDNTPNFEVRLGSIYTLRRISEDNERDHLTVMDTLCAYVRFNSIQRKVDDKIIAVYTQDIDTQAAVIAIGKRSYDRCALEFNARNEISLQRSYLVKSELNRLRFPMINLDESDLRYSELTNADFRQASLHETNFQHSNLMGCKLERASLRGADLSEARNVTQEMLDAAFGVKGGQRKETKLPDKMEHPEHWFESKLNTHNEEELLNEYIEAYRNFLSTKEDAWYPEEESCFTKKSFLG